MIVSLLEALSCGFIILAHSAFLLEIPDQFSLVIWDYLGKRNWGGVCMGLESIFTS